MNNKKIAFIGGGNMAQSLISGLIKANYPKDLIYVSTPHAEKVAALKEKYGINTSTSNIEIMKSADVIVLAVKPQMFKDAVAEVNQTNSDFSNKLIISVMAGITVNRIQELMGHAKEVIRVMPNTPCLIGYGMSGLFASNETTSSNIEFADSLLKSCGKTSWVKTENAINDITALSGSAPAYFFLFMECLVNKALELGFSEPEARAIVEQVAIGSSQMVINNQNKTISELRAAVTSKGGTTYEALQVFNNSNLNDIVSKALDACKARAEEMSKQF